MHRKGAVSERYQWQFILCIIAVIVNNIHTRNVKYWQPFEILCWTAHAYKLQLLCTWSYYQWC